LALHKYVKDEKLPIDLYLVMLTDAHSDRALSEIEDGTSFNDTVAPVTALLSVRRQLAARAVTRAVDEVTRAVDEAAPLPGTEELAGCRGSSKILKVNLLQATFDLPLGWMISGTTDDIIHLMLGSPDLAPGEPPEAGGGERSVADEAGKEIRDAVRVIRNNSCVKKRLIELLAGETPS